MTMVSIGDLAQSVALRQQNARLRQAITTLAQEMSTSQAADLPRHLKGNYAYLGDIEHGMRVNQGYGFAVREAAGFAGAMQAALDNVQDVTTALSGDLALSGGSALPEAMSAASKGARGALDAILSALNTEVAGRALFSGAATDRQSFAPAQIFIDQLKAALATVPPALGDITAAVDDWFFGAGGGFETAGYLGATRALSPFPISEGETVGLDLRGDAQELRLTLRNVVLAALAADPDLSYSNELQGQILTVAGEGLMTSQGQLATIRADLGYAEARIEETQARLSAENTSLEIARNELLGVDPYETAIRLENAQFQLEALYTATVSVSRLSLVEYL